MRISYWSSDVCSSDLSLPLPSQEEGPGQELAAEAAPTRTFGVVPDDNPQDRNMKPILLDGKSLTQRQLAGIAYGAPVELSADALRNVARAAEFLAEQVRRAEPTYGVSTGFGRNADKLLGAHPLRDELPGTAPSGRSLTRKETPHP